MKKRDANRLEDLKFSTSTVSSLDASDIGAIKPKGAKISPTKRAFFSKLEDERYNDFKHTDWMHYFQTMYKKANNIGYSVRGKNEYIKQYAVLKSLMQNYTTDEIRNLIDFLFESNQDIIVNKLQITVYHLSSGWLSSIYPSSQAWIAGEFKTKRDIWDEQARKSEQANKRNREWTEEPPKEEANTKQKKFIVE